MNSYQQPFCVCTCNYAYRARGFYDYYLYLAKNCSL